MKKLLSVILTLAMILSLATVLTVTSSAAAWNGTDDVSPELSGEGTEANPYKITSGADFAYIRDQVNGGETFAGKYFSIENGIFTIIK